ncbi:hypothetical protein GOV07_01970 [Candidatus Woesearchaeota archaeon]|nr:hypothetical protein [Candidatus Woesearchaeota archaeon]
MAEPKKSEQEIEDLEHSLCIVVLAAIAEIPKNFGYTKTIGFLKGSKSRYVIQNKLDKNEYFGILSAFSSSILESIIGYLHDQSLIEKVEVGKFNRPTLVVSKFGLRVLGKREKIKLNAHIFNKKEEINVSDEVFYQKISKLRYEIAKRENLPAFCICTNETLIEITNQKPKTKEELLNIKGVGEKFIDNYSEEFLDIINRN